ncbi:hypothetical protein ACEWK1_14500 [Metabacillus sp. YM-086]|uniref:hypothetical protein n=1 Tax=Metabacillus sp. YM-086 TaxID=3341729 RepID=UPI003A85196A
MFINVSNIDLNPKHGVLASANIKIGDILTIRGAELKRNSRGYTIAFPQVLHKSSQCIKINDSDLSERIIDAFQAQYEKKIRKASKSLTDGASYDSEYFFIENSNQRQAKQVNIRSYNAYRDPVAKRSKL